MLVFFHNLDSLVCFFLKNILKALENVKPFPYNKRGKLFRDGDKHEK